MCLLEDDQCDSEQQGSSYSSDSKKCLSDGHRSPNVSLHYDFRAKLFQRLLTLTQDKMLTKLSIFFSKKCFSVLTVGAIWDYSNSTVAEG